MKYALAVSCKEAVGVKSGKVITEEGEWFWVVKCEWVPGTCVPYKRDKIPHDVLVWDTEEEAAEFSNSWGGHPWFCKPKAFEVIPVIPRMVTVQDGWKTTAD